ncbi:hypothetical protein JW710_02990 [Candidatus Dojkabacteria bacterium]|nr:hypothetical protein [Candidatus Dojkabacteria bacterium]
MGKIVIELKYIWSVFLLKLDMWSVYRLKLIVWIISGILEPIIWSVLWYVTAQESADLVMSGAEILSYYLLTALMNRITRSWTFDTLRKEIREGRYTKYLLWPKGIIGFRIGADWSDRVVTLAALLPFWFIWLFILQSKGLFEVTISNIGLFFVAVILATFVRFYLDMFLAHLALFWVKLDGLSTVYWSAYRLFGGITVPLVLLPAWAFGITKIMPFRYVVSFPIEVFQGLISNEEIIRGFIICMAWIIVEYAALQVVFRVGIKNYESVGA